jgi:hypothetical protein
MEGESCDSSEANDEISDNHWLNRRTSRQGIAVACLVAGTVFHNWSAAWNSVRG